MRQPHLLTKENPSAVGIWQRRGTGCELYGDILCWEPRERIWRRDHAEIDIEIYEGHSCELQRVGK
jgi:hypothetical protein